MADIAFSADVAMAVVLGVMGTATIYTTWKEWREDEQQ